MQTANKIIRLMQDLAMFTKQEKEILEVKPKKNVSFLEVTKIVGIYMGENSYASVARRANTTNRDNKYRTLLSRADVKGNRKLILELIQERTLLLVSGRIESSAFSLSLDSCSFSLAFSLVLLPSFFLPLSFWFSPSFLPSFLCFLPSFLPSFLR